MPTLEPERPAAVPPLNQPKLLLLCRLLKQQLPRLLDAAANGIPGAVDALVLIASTASDIGGRACTRSEVQPALDTSTHARVARSLNRRLMTLVSERARTRTHANASASLEAIGWPQIAVAILPRTEPLPMPPIAESVAMYLTVGDRNAAPREAQQVGASAVHTCTRGWVRASLSCMCARCIPTRPQEVLGAIRGSDSDVYVALPTGAGKSLTYTYPALLDGVTHLVVGPLVSLALDQARPLVGVSRPQPLP